MSLLRLIARLDIKGQKVVKGISFEGLRIVGDPIELGVKYAREGADELFFIDTVSSLYNRSQLLPLLEQTTDDVFIPVTVGGGIKSLADAKRLLDAGADKIAINTAAIADPSLIADLSNHYGSQAIVVSIEAKRHGGAHAGGSERKWEALTHNGRERTGVDACWWAQEAVRLGAGELIVTSVDQDGTRRGFDVELIAQIAPRVPVPVVAAGGCWSVEHVCAVLDEGRADAVAIGSALHYGALNFGRLRHELNSRKLHAEA